MLSAICDNPDCHDEHSSRYIKIMDIRSYVRCQICSILTLVINPACLLKMSDAKLYFKVHRCAIIKKCINVRKFSEDKGEFFLKYYLKGKKNIMCTYTDQVESQYLSFNCGSLIVVVFHTHNLNTYI